MKLRSPMWIAEILRLFTIQRVFLRYGLGQIIWASHPFRSLRFIEKLLPWNWLAKKPSEPIGKRLRYALEDLAPVFVKFGQLLSTRHDLLPEEITNELSLLQDNVPPFSGAHAQKIIEQALGKPVEKLFAHFDATPLASASIAQVHAATMYDGRRVIVKVVRPHIKKIIARDIALLKRLANTAERYSKALKRLRPVNVVLEFERTLANELNMLGEAANASQLRRNFEGSTELYIPEIFWKYTCCNVLVMERIEGVPLKDPQISEKTGHNEKEISTTLIRVLFSQIFKDSFFHADLHPGNIFVLPKNDHAPALLAVVDFGIMSTLSESNQHYLAKNFLAFLNRDYRSIAKLHIESGWVAPDTRSDEFESDIRIFCEPLLNRPIAQINMGEALLALLKTAFKFKMEILPELLLLQKTLMSVEGLARKMNPEINMWETARPVFIESTKKTSGLHGFYHNTMAQLPLWLEKLPHAPLHLMAMVEELRQGKLKVKLQEHELALLKQEVRHGFSLLSVSVLGVGLIVALLLLFARPEEAISLRLSLSCVAIFVIGAFMLWRR